jgi:hypothetical protein
VWHRCHYKLQISGGTPQDRMGSALAQGRVGWTLVLHGLRHADSDQLCEQVMLLNQAA